MSGSRGTCVPQREAHGGGEGGGDAGITLLLSLYTMTRPPYEQRSELQREDAVPHASGGFLLSVAPKSSKRECKRTLGKQGA